MDLVELLARHTPCFFLPGERVDPYAVPTSFDQLLSMVRRVTCADSGRILRDGAITHEDVGSLLGDPAVELVRLQLSATARLGDRTVHIDDVPIYASVKEIRGDHEALELTYVTLFPYNGPYFGGIGAHDGDIEHITVRLNGDGELTGVWYNSHRSVDGMWVAASDVELDRESGRIASYVAKSGHGHYPQAGRWWRHFGLGNDICRRDVKWCPKTVIWIDSHAVSVPCRGPVCELAGGGERAVRVSPVDPARVDASGTRRHLADKKLRYWGQAAGLAHQPWFRVTAESPRSRRWWMRVCTFFHLLDT